MNKKFWATTFTLTGTIIGAGILALPNIFAESGFLTGIFWLILIGTIMIFTNLTLGEITLRTKDNHQLTGYAEKYLGIWGKLAMFLAFTFGVYSALLAYLIAEGQSLSRLISPSIQPIFFTIIFWLIMTLLLGKGLVALKKIETWGVLTIIIIVFGIFTKLASQIKIQNLATFSKPNFTTPIGVIMFALMGFTAIPELKKEIKGQEKLLKKAIIIGTIIPILLYTIFSLTFVGILGKSANEIATLSFGPITIILGIFAMLTSYLILSYSLNDTLKTDLKITARTSFLLTSMFPLLLYIGINYLNKLNFTSIIGISGTISGGITGILILLMAKKAKSYKRNKQNPEIQLPINYAIIIIISLLFIVGIILQLAP